MAQETEDMQATQELVAEKVNKENCILFLGAGVHWPPPEDSEKWNYPKEQRPYVAEDLAEKLAEDCHYRERFPKEQCLDLQRVSLYFEESRGRNELVNSLTKHLKVGKQPSPALKMLAKLPFKIFVTTNYDPLLEDALNDCKKDPHCIVYNPNRNARTPDVNQDPTAQQPLLFKMHGSLDQRDSIVITDEDYITFVQRMSDKDTLHPLPQTVRYRMQMWPILFVGYSLRDYNLRLIFRTLRWRVDPANFPRAYSIDKNPDPLILQLWQHQRQFIMFLTQDLWTFVPWLSERVDKMRKGKDNEHE